MNKRVTLERECQRCNRNWGKKWKSVWRRRIYRKYVSWNRLQKNMGRNLNADIILRRSRGSPGQWFPETDSLCASAIFVVGTSGIPPNLNYRSVSPIRSPDGVKRYHLVGFDATTDDRKNKFSWKRFYKIKEVLKNWPVGQNKIFFFLSSITLNRN